MNSQFDFRKSFEPSRQFMPFAIELAAAIALNPAHHDERTRSEAGGERETVRRGPHDGLD